MNVLILTPDAVGSTLLQRLITVYMQLQHFSKPIINLHELTNGLSIYYSDVFNQKVLGKPVDRSYHQSLQEVQDLLCQVNHWSTSRLAKYHLDRRNDTIEQQVPFFNYLNQNFFIIATRRQNVFEHAISWCINSFTKKLNVYDAGEKITSFLEFYKDPVVIDTILMTSYLNTYKEYLSWSTQYFNVGSFFCYEEHLPNIENYILNLPIFTGQNKISWHDAFGIPFTTWNQIHHLTSDLESLAVRDAPILQQINLESDNLDFTNIVYPPTQLLSDYNCVKDESWPVVQSWHDFENLPPSIKQECITQHQLQSIYNRNVVSSFLDTLSESNKKFLYNHRKEYQDAGLAISQMIDLGILVGPLPIKKQTLAGKKAMVKNWQQCIDVYNAWIDKNPNIGDSLDSDKEAILIEKENKLWYSVDSIKHLSSN
jgi:hypothetical protein